MPDQEFFFPRPPVTPTIYAYALPGVASHQGYIKVGYTERADANERISQQLHTSGLRHKLLFTESAMRPDGSCFTDREVHAVLRRSGSEEESGEKKLTFDKLVINLDSYELLVDGKRVDTPPKELELLYHLASSPNRVFTRNQLLDEVWGFDYFGDSRTVDVHIKRLREKLEGVSDQWSLKTVWGVGYKFEVNPQ